mmetsp:Transcript_2186/g.2116  ORF Transcript_2186/g.2116 Transcript_2186/m.2116 type:complete len:84 (-) Transcript_2186:43-294(-)
MMGAYWVEIDPSTYVFQRFDKTSGTFSCKLGFELHIDSTWYMGNVLFRNFYTVWEGNVPRVWFAPKTGGLAEVIDATTPTATL